MSGVLRPIAPLAYTGARATEYQRLRTEFDNKTITGKALREQVIRLNENQRKYNDRLAKARERRAFEKQQREAFEREVRRAEEAERKRVEEALSAERVRKMVEAVRIEREAREAKRKAQAKARSEEKKRLAREVKAFAGTVIYDSRDFNEERCYRACQELAGNDYAYVQISRNGEIVFSDMIAINGKPKEIYHKFIKKVIFPYDEDIFARRNGEERAPIVRVVISRAQDIPTQKIKQAFREGSTHCVLEPLIQLFSSYIENSESKATKKRYQQVVNKLRGLLEIYDGGVPEDKMEEVAKACYRCLVVYDVLGNEVMRYNKNSPKMFHFTNTRENHLETGHLTMDKQYTNVSQDELNTIMMEHDKDGCFYLFRGDIKKSVPQSIRSSRGAWAVFNDDYELFQQFNKEMKVRDYRINAVKYPVLNDFIKDGTIIHSGAVALCKKPNKLDGVSHYDMTKAYTQHATAPYFSGFMGHIHQWALLSCDLDFVRSHLGVYRFRVVENVEILQRLGMRTGKEYTLPGPELLYMCDVLGLRVELLAGCWGSRAEINYTPEMLEKRRYCTWAGKLGMESMKDCYLFKGSYDWACHLKGELGEDRVSFWGDFICVKNPKGAVWTTHHLFAFITSYSRIHMLEMMRRVDGELVKVVLDGLYFRGTMNTEGLPAKIEEDKKLKIHKGFTDGWYSSSSAVIDWEPYSSMLDGDRVLAGAGGTGKSWRVFNDKSIYQPLYVVPSHLLGRKFRSEYGVSYTTIHKLIGMDCMPYGEENGAPHNIFIDELTMMDKEWVETAVTMYPSSRFYIAGDIDGERWYQCRNGGAGDYSEIWIPSREEWTYVDFTKDMRSKDEELRIFKEDVRAVMRGVFTDGGMSDAYRINDIVKRSCKTVSFDDAVKMFRPGNVWIAGTHRTNTKLLEAGVVSGLVNHRKEAIFADSMEGEKGDMRGSFTVHSFQGLTISDRKVFVSLDMFEYAMFYTAISRVCHFNQLVIVA